MWYDSLGEAPSLDTTLELVVETIQNIKALEHNILVYDVVAKLNTYEQLTGFYNAKPPSHVDEMAN